MLWKWRKYGSGPDRASPEHATVRNVFHKEVTGIHFCSIDRRIRVNVVGQIKKNLKKFSPLSKRWSNGKVFGFEVDTGLLV